MSVAAFAQNQAASNAGGNIAPPKREVFESLQYRPSFPTDIRAYIHTHLTYPADVDKTQLDGRIILKFIVNEDGSVSDVRIVKSDNEKMNNAAMDVVKGMPKWNPGKENDQPVAAYMMVVINLKSGD